MSNAAIPSYLEIVDFIAAGATPQAVVDYHPSAGAQQRVAELIGPVADPDDLGGLPPLQPPGHGSQNHFLYLHRPLHFCG